MGSKTSRTIPISVVLFDIGNNVYSINVRAGYTGTGDI